VHFYFLLFNTLKMVQHVSNLILGSSSGTSVLNYTSPSSKVHVRLYTLKCCLCCLVVTIYQIIFSLVDGCDPQAKGLQLLVSCFRESLD
jgi:hypothetical protein